MSLVKWGFIGLLALPVAELLVFIVVALSIGWLLALALFLATSLIGMMVLKRSGADFQRFRSDLARQGAGAIQLETPSLAAMIGGISGVSGLYHRYSGRAALAAMGPALGSSGVWDVAMNIHGADVERRSRRSMMPRFHAVFSVGMVAGALIGVGMVALGVPLTAHLLIVAGVVSVVAIPAARCFLDVITEPPRSAGRGRALARWRSRGRSRSGCWLLSRFAEGRDRLDQRRADRRLRDLGGPRHAGLRPVPDRDDRLRWFGPACSTATAGWSWSARAHRGACRDVLFVSEPDDAARVRRAAALGRRRGAGLSARHERGPTNRWPRPGASASSPRSATGRSSLARR